MIVRDASNNFPVISIQEHFATGRGLQHPLKHPMVALFGQGLEFLPEITVIPVGADRNASANGGIELTRMFFPLLERVVLEELLVQLPANLRDDNFFGVCRVLNRNPLLLQPGFEFLSGALPAQELLEGVEIDREVPVSGIRITEDAVINLMPLGKAGEVLPDAWGIRPKIVRTVFVNQNPSSVILVLGIATDVIPFLDNRALRPKLARKPLSKHQAGKTRTDD